MNTTEVETIVTLISEEVKEIGYELACEEGGCEPAKIAVARAKIGSRISSVGRGRPMSPVICVPRGGLMSISPNPASRCSEAVTAFSRAGSGIW